MLASYNGTAITYDALGNPLTYGSNTYTWYGRRMATYSNGTKTASYKYDENGIRTSKTVNGTKTSFFVDGTTILAQKTGNTTIPYYYDGNGKRIAFKYNGNMYFYVYNLQGDVTHILDDDANIVGTYTYDSWGKITNLSSLTSIAQTNPFRYRGYYYDTESGLYYLNSRYYNPEWGRFLNIDSGIYATDCSVHGYNMFAYCSNNPIVRVDHSGQFWDTVLDVISLGASIVDVVKNYSDPLSWAGLVADIISLAVPCVTGGGTIVKAASKADNVIDVINSTNKVDSIADTGKAIKNARSRAVKKAWQNEVELVKSTGKGTREWTAAEIDELLNTGKVKGYVGHHMKSVKKYPDLAGDPLNIQFLTPEKHLLAHNGNWRNITNGRFLE